MLPRVATAALACLLLIGCANETPPHTASLPAAADTASAADTAGSVGAVACPTRTGCAAQLELQQLGTAKAMLPFATIHANAATPGVLHLAVIVRNSALPLHGAPLQVTAIVLTNTTSDADGSSSKVADWTCDLDKGQPCSQAAAAMPVLQPGGAQSSFHLRHTQSASGTAKIRVCVQTAGDPAVPPEGQCFWAVHTIGAPKLQVEPVPVSFQGAAATSAVERTLIVRNKGGVPLNLHAVALQLPAVYSLKVAGKVLAGAGKLPLGRVLAPQASEMWLLVRAPGPPDVQQNGALVVFSDDPQWQNGLQVAVETATGDCLLLSSAAEGLQPPVTPGGNSGTATVMLQNCSAWPVAWIGAHIEDLGVEAGPGFAIDWQATAQKLPAIDAQTGPTPEAPLNLAPGAAVAVELVYTAAQLGLLQAKLTVDTANGSQSLQLEAMAVQEECPVANTVVVEGEQVVPQTTIHLSAKKSTAAPPKAIVKYLWTSKQPAGSKAVFQPSANVAEPMLEAILPGEYEFCLSVWDSVGLGSCLPACQKVLVIPTTNIHVELYWSTPGDPDQNDSGPGTGADLDLHFAHMLAATGDLDCDGKPDPWFNNPWDCFWFNASPEWGAAGKLQDNPTMDLDASSGSYPENLVLTSSDGTADDPASYSVGVHYWNDYGFGVSHATVSIYLQGTLTLQFTQVALQPRDMWYVGKVNWPNSWSGGSKKSFDTCYQSGDSCAAGKNLMWQPKGAFCITKCYEIKAFGNPGGKSAGSCGP